MGRAQELMRKASHYGHWKQLAVAHGVEPHIFGHLEAAWRDGYPERRNKRIGAPSVLFATGWLEAAMERAVKTVKGACRVS